MYLLREAAASKEINLQRLLLFILLYPIVPTFLVSNTDDSVVILLVFNEKKAEPSSFKGSAIISGLFFFFSHECIENFFNHVPFSFGFDLLQFAFCAVFVFDIGIGLQFNVFIF